MSERYTVGDDTPMVYVGKIPIAEAIIRRAQELYGHTVYIGTYGEAGLRSSIVSLSGSFGDTFKDAEAGIQIAKARTKDELRALHPQLAATEFSKKA